MAAAMKAKTRTSDTGEKAVTPSACAWAWKAAADMRFDKVGATHNGDDRAEQIAPGSASPEQRGGGAERNYEESCGLVAGVSGDAATLRSG
jgi:hypothetical protein